MSDHITDNKVEKSSFLQKMDNFGFRIGGKVEKGLRLFGIADFAPSQPDPNISPLGRRIDYLRQRSDHLRYRAAGLLGFSALNSMLAIADFIKPEQDPKDIAFFSMAAGIVALGGSAHEALKCIASSQQAASLEAVRYQTEGILPAELPGLPIPVEVVSAQTK